MSCVWIKFSSHKLFFLCIFDQIKHFRSCRGGRRVGEARVGEEGVEGRRDGREGGRAGEGRRKGREGGRVGKDIIRAVFGVVGG